MPTPPDTRVQELHLTFPPAPKPMAKYRPVVRVGNLLYTSGHGPLHAGRHAHQGPGRRRPDGGAGLPGRPPGRAGDAGHAAANLGSLNKVKRLVKTFGLVLCTPEFTDQPKVMNGFSEPMAEVFGDEAGVGRAARLAPALPSGMAVEVECVFEVE